MASEDGPPFPAFLDAEGKIAAVYGAGGAPTVFVLDPNLRVLEAFRLGDGRAAAGRILEPGGRGVLLRDRGGDDEPRDLRLRLGQYGTLAVGGRVRKTATASISVTCEPPRVSAA